MEPYIIPTFLLTYLFFTILISITLDKRNNTDDV
jgi:hypothetical protein